MIFRKILIAIVSCSYVSLLALSATDAQANNISSKKTQDLIQTLEDEKNVTDVYRVYFGNETMMNKLSISFHSQLQETHKSKGYMIIELSKEDLKKLKPFNFKIEKANDFIKRRNQRLEQLQNQLKSNSLFNAEPTAIPGYACYETVEETFLAAQNFTTDYPNLAEWVDVGDSWEKGANLGGYDIRVLVLTNKSNNFEKPKLFINSAIHAREYTTAPLNLDFARWLLNGYADNADARWILDHHEVHLMLQTNPDGRKKAEAGSSWRKNTNQNYCGATSSRRGADLNRNFTDRWDITNGSGSSGNQCSDTYRGPSAGSEPEIQAIENYIRSIFPDLRGPNDNDAAPDTTTGMHIDIHSYSELVLWPWGDKNTPAPNGAALQSLGRKFAFFNGYLPQQSIGLYATDGTSDSVSYSELGVPAITFELGTSFFQNCSTYNNTIKPDNLPALIYAAKVVSAPYVTPSGPDILNLSLSDDASTTGVPAGTSVEISASASDTRFSTRNGTESTQNISGAEYYIDVPPWQDGAVAIPLGASDGNYNNKTESISGLINTSSLSVGEHIVFVRSKDTTNTFGAISASFLKITDDTTPPLSADFAFDCTALTCSFDGALSSGQIANYEWGFGDGSSDAGVNVQHTFSQAGTYSVSLTVRDNNSGSDVETKSVTVSDVSGNELQNGVTISGLSGDQAEELQYFINVPADAANLTFNITGGSGDADLYVKFGSEPTASDYDCRPYRNGNQETCNVTNVQAGRYFVMLRGYRAFSGVSLTASYTKNGTGGSFEQSDLSGAEGQWQHFAIQIPAGMSSLNVEMSGGNGDADLYVRKGSEATLNQYDCRPYRWGNNETCAINNPAADTWYISIRGYSSFSDVNISAQWN